MFAGQGPEFFFNVFQKSKEDAEEKDEWREPETPEDFELMLRQMQREGALEDEQEP